MTNRFESLRPYGNRVLVRRLPLPDTVESGLYLLGRDYPTMGTVLAKGKGTRLKKKSYTPPYHRAIDIKVGSIVQWRVGLNFDLYDLGNDLLLLPYSELNFVLEA